MSFSSFRQPHNPYASTPSGDGSQTNGSGSGSDVHHALTRVLHHPSNEAFQRLESIVSNRSWTLPLAERLTDAALTEKTRERQDALLLFLAQVLPKWDDSLLYAIAASYQDRLIPTLVEWMDSGSRQPVGFVALAHVWNSLERIQGVTSWNAQRVDTAWWYADEYRLNEMAHAALDILLNRHDGTPTQLGMEGSTVATDEIRSSCALFLCSLLKHDVKDWMYEIDDLAAVVNKLTLQTHPLDDQDENSLGSIQLAFASMALLSALEWKHYDPQTAFTRLGSLVDHVSKVAFRIPSGGSPSGPRWTYEPVATSLRPGAESLLYIWNIAQLEQPSERYWLPFAEAGWTAILASTVPESVSGLLFLLTSTCRLQVRRCLHSILTSSPSQDTMKLVDACRGLVASLLNQCQNSDLSVAISSAALLRSLLSDRQDITSHDELSRSLWSAMDAFPPERLVNGIAKLSSGDSNSSRACQPLLLCMLDIVDLLLSYPEGSRSSALDLGAQRVESLIEVMSSFGACVLKRRDERNVFEMEEDTPPTSNLSLLDDSHISPEESSEAIPSLKGLERNIRIAAATVLARMGYAAVTNHPSDAPVEQSQHLLRTRIRGAIHDFITSIHSLANANGQPSFSWIHRLVRLSSLMATSSAENERLVATTLAELDRCRGKELQDRNQDLLEYERKLEEARVHARAIVAEKERCQRAMRSQALVCEQNIMRDRKHATTDATHLVEVHASERAKAEARAVDSTKRLEQAETKRVASESRAEVACAAEAKATQALQEALSKLEIAERKLEEQNDLAEDFRSESTRAAQELAMAREELREYSGRNESTGRDLEVTREALSETKQAYANLQDELEVVFANLSCLAQVYQAKDEEVSTIVESKDRAIQEARRNSDKELRRNEELVQNQTRLELENERLTQKLSRAKEKLQEVRQAQREQEERRKRHGPVSYINQLHSKSSGSRSDRSDKALRGDRKVLPGKENRSYFSSSS